MSPRNFFVSMCRYLFLLILCAIAEAGAADVEDSSDTVAEKATALIRENRRYEAAAFLYDKAQSMNSEAYHCQFDSIKKCVNLVTEHHLMDEIVATRRPPADAP